MANYFLIVIYFITRVLICKTTEGHVMHDLYSNLMKHYEKDVRPSFAHDQTLNVTFAFSLAQIIDVDDDRERVLKIKNCSRKSVHKNFFSAATFKQIISNNTSKVLGEQNEMDEKNQILTTNTWINQGWFDNHLKWNPKEYENISTIHVPNNRIWLPDIVLYNNADSHYKKAIVSTDVFVKSDGNVTWLTAAIFKSSCEMNVRYYPFDEQICYLKFASWSYDGSLVNLLSNKIGDYSNYMPSSEWDLVYLGLEETNENFSCCPDEFFPIVRVTIRLKRKPMFYVFNFILPCVLISTLSLFGFYMPSNSGEKVTLGITSLLSITVFMLLVAETMPPTSRNLPLIGTYYIATLLLVSLTTLLTVITLNIHHKGEHGYRLPRFIKILVFKYLAPVLFLKVDPPIVRMYERKQALSKGSKFRSFTSLKTNNANFCKNTAIKKSIYQSVHLETSNDDTTANSNDIPDMELPKNSYFQGEFFVKYLEVLQKLYSTIENAQVRQHKKLENDILKREWQQLALVIDKFLLIVFLFATVISSFLIIFQKDLIIE